MFTSPVNHNGSTENEQISSSLQLDERVAILSNVFHIRYAFVLQQIGTKKNTKCHELFLLGYTRYIAVVRIISKVSQSIVIIKFQNVINAAQIVHELGSLVVRHLNCLACFSDIKRSSLQSCCHCFLSFLLLILFLLYK